jgi:hypothetical protein
MKRAKMTPSLAKQSRPRQVQVTGLSVGSLRAKRVRAQSAAERPPL